MIDEPARKPEYGWVRNSAGSKLTGRESEFERTYTLYGQSRKANTNKNQKAGRWIVLPSYLCSNRGGGYSTPGSLSVPTAHTRQSNQAGGDQQQGGRFGCGR
jgi:hypothetical protein